jgi:hypothetical protein
MWAIGGVTPLILNFGPGRFIVLLEIVGPEIERAKKGP